MKIRVLSQDEWAEAEAPAVRAVNEKYVVRLNEGERAWLESLTRSGKGAAQTLRHACHAWVLLKADASEAGPAWSDEQIRAAFEVGLSTIARVRRAYVDAGLEAALRRRPSERVYPRKVDGTVEAHRSVANCSRSGAGPEPTPAPTGRALAAESSRSCHACSTSLASWQAPGSALKRGFRTLTISII